jgi:hypothetical protein
MLSKAKNLIRRLCSDFERQDRNVDRDDKVGGQNSRTCFEGDPTVFANELVMG